MPPAGSPERSQTNRSPWAICVLGMHRSGTSALTGVLKLLGVELGANLLPGRVDNPKGFWEHRGILEIHDALLDSLHSSFDDFFPLPAGWHRRPGIGEFRDQLIDLLRADFGTSPLWGFKDPRTCRLLPMWFDIFSAVHAAPRFVFVLRDPREIAMSLAARDGYSINTSMLLTLVHLLEAETATRGQARIFLPFEQILSDWRGALSRVSRDLGITWPKEFSQVQGEVDKFIDPKLRHHASDDAAKSSGESADGDALRWATEAHEVFLAAAAGGEIDTRRLDRLRAQFDSRRPRLDGWRNRRSPHRELMRLENWSAELRQENNWLRLALLRLGLEPRQIIAAIKQDVAGESDLAALASGAPASQARLGVELAQREAELKEIREKVKSLTLHKDELEKRHTWLDAHVAELEKYNTELMATARKDDATLRERDQIIKKLEAWTAEQETSHAWLAKEHAALLMQFAQREEMIRSLEKWSAQLTTHRDQLLEQQAQSNEALATRDREIEKLTAWAAELETGRRWLGEQLGAAQAEIARSQAAHEETRKWAKELESAKDWLAQHRENLEAELKRRDDAAASEAAAAVDSTATRPEQEIAGPNTPASAVNP